jgi:hypothetical protein
MPQEGEKDDDRNGNSQQVKQNSTAHDFLLFSGLAYPSVRLALKSRTFPPRVAVRLAAKAPKSRAAVSHKGRIYFVLAPGAPTIYRLQRDRAIADPPRASNYFRGAEQPSDARLCRRSIKGRQIHGQSEVRRQVRDGNFIWKTTRRTLPPWICSSSRLLASNCFMPSSSFG